MKELHEGPLRGHFAIEIAKKTNIKCSILVANYVQKCA